MLAAGIPMVQAFEIVGNGNDKPAMQKLILDIKSDVEGGTALAEALAKHPLQFDDLSSTWCRQASRQVPSSPCSTRSPPTKKKPKR